MSLPESLIKPEARGIVRPIDLDHEMRAAYLDYAMSVIVARALPDVRDGLKPVHRRILYAMHTMGLRHDKPHRKSARIVGEVLGKFHPHGDTAVYDAMVRMAQTFSMRYPLVDGQGNFGSIDGDSAAAMRYTEARLTEIAEEMLADIEKETVDFGPNFDETLEEPLVLPAALPNLLVNGSSGIAVGMATNIPSHNLGEVVDALAFVIDHYHAVEEITLEHLLYFIKGPDFPTGGIIFRYRDAKEGRQDTIATAYGTGRAKLTVQAKVHVETMSRSRSRLVITELPYQTNNGRVVERIAELVRDGRLEGIGDLRDESDRQGMRIVVELQRGVEPKDMLEELYKLTPMRQTYGFNTLALVDGEPRLLSLKRMLQLFIEHRREIVRRRSEYDLKRSRERAHILEGLLIALANLDEVIQIIRRSPDTDTARERLMQRFKLSEIQAQAILDMPLKRLSRLEREKLEAEYKEVKDRIAYLEDLLAHPQKILGVIKDELLALKAKYGDARRTQIVDVEGAALVATDFLSEEEVLVMVTKSGQIFQQSLAGRRRGSLPRRTADAPVAMAASSGRNTLFLFTAAGQAVARDIHQVPTEEGTNFTEIFGLRGDDEIVTLLGLAAPENGEAEGQSLFLYTREGRCKRIAVADLFAAAHNSPLVMNIEPGDALLGVLPCDTGDDIVLLTRLGQGIRFAQDEVRVMGLPAAGVLAIKLEKGDQVAGCGLCKPQHQVVLLTGKGFGLRTMVDQYPVQKRYGGGVAAIKLQANQGAVEAAALVESEHEMFPVLSKGPMRVLRLEDVPSGNRAGRGKAIPALADGELQRLLALIIPKVKESEGAPEPPPPPPPPSPPPPAPPAPAPTRKSVRTAAVKPLAPAPANEAPAATTHERPASPARKAVGAKILAATKPAAAQAEPETTPEPVKQEPAAAASTTPAASQAEPKQTPNPAKQEPAAAAPTAAAAPATAQAPRVTRASVLDELPKTKGTAKAASQPAAKTPATTPARKPTASATLAKEQPKAGKSSQGKAAPVQPAAKAPDKAPPAGSKAPAKTGGKGKADLTQASLFEPPPAVPAKPSTRPPAGAKPKPAKTPEPEPPPATEAKPGSLETIKKRIRTRKPGAK